MQYRPHEYQRRAEEFVMARPASVLMLDMGLGKTVVALTAAERLMREGAVRRALVIAPLRVAKVTWPAERAKWDHLASLTMAVATGTREERGRAIAEDAAVTVINRENVPWLVEAYGGSRWRWDMLIVDELSGFRNPRSKRLRALLKARPKARRFIGLTGTPAPKGLMDLWAEYRLADMGRSLGRFIGSYRERWFVPGRRRGAAVWEWLPREGAEEEIHRAIAPVTMSLRAEDWLDMPGKAEIDIPVRLSEGEMAGYRRLCRDMLLSLPGGEVTASGAGVLAGKLMQLTSGAVYTEDGRWAEAHRRKTDALAEVLEGMRGRPLLVCWWYRHERERAIRVLESMSVRWADIGAEESVRAWNAGELGAGLMHPASAGHGLNLQEGGSVMLWLTVPWDLELYSQAVARLWRQGQRGRTVRVLRLVAEGTIDERAVAALSEKGRRQDALLEAVKAELRPAGTAMEEA